MSESPNAYSRFSHRLNKHRQEGFTVCTFLSVRVCVVTHAKVITVTTDRFALV